MERFENDTYEAAFKQLEDNGLTEKQYDTEPLVDAKPAEGPETVAAKSVKEDEAKAFGDEWSKQVNAKSEAMAARKGDAPQQSFKQAWAAARAENVKSGTNKPFEFNGKQFSTENKAEAAARKAKRAGGQAAAAVSKESQMPAPMSDKVAPKPTRPMHANGKPNLAPADAGINGEKSLPARVLDTAREKMDGENQVGKAKFHANGRPNLTAM